jgi:hypothetical protein
MTRHVTYSCSLCRRPLERKGGHALKWDGPGVAYPETGATLIRVLDWDQAPIHLCEVCVKAISELDSSSE